MSFTGIHEDNVPSMLSPSIRYKSLRHYDSVPSISSPNIRYKSLRNYRVENLKLVMWCLLAEEDLMLH